MRALGSLYDVPLRKKNNNISSLAFNTCSNICSLRKKWSHVTDTKAISVTSIKKREKKIS